MRRREFLGLMGCGAGLAIAGVSVVAGRWLPGPGDRMPLFVGLGNAGSNFVKHLPEMVDGARGDYPFIGAAFNRDHGQSATPLGYSQRARISDAAVISRHARDVSRVVLMAGLSRATGGELITRVAQRYREEGADVVAVVTLPFTFEGNHWRVDAERQLADLRAVGIPVRVFDNAQVLQELPPNAAMIQAYRQANSKVIQVATSAAWPTAREQREDPANA